MTKIPTVPIYRDDEEIHAESWVPAETVPGWLAQGWLEGRLPELEQADAEKAAVDAENARIAAEEWAAAHPSDAELEERRLAAEAEQTPEPEEITDPADSGDGETAPTGHNPQNPEEGES